MATLALGGCSLLSLVGLGGEDAPPPVAPPPPPPPPPLSEQPWALALELAAGPGLNPDARGRPSPIRVHVFLTEPVPDPARRAFAEAFDPAGTPAPNAILTLRPGTRTRIALDAVRTRTRLTVAAAFRDPASSAWIDARTLAPDGAGDEIGLTVSIDADRVRIGDPGNPR